MQAGIFLGVTATATVAAAWRAAGRLAGREGLDRTFATIVLALGGLCAVLLVLGVAGVLTRTGVGIAVVVVAAGVFLRVPATPSGGWAPPDARGERLAVLAIGAFAVGLAVALSLHGVTTSSDSLQYHVPNAATWLKASSLLELPITPPGFFTNAYPSDQTLSALWLMLATGSDQLAYLVNVMWGVLAVLGAALLARELGGRWTTGALLALGVVVTPIVFLTHADSLYSDLAAAGGTVAGAAAALRATRDPRPTPWAVLAGVALGLAVGSKYTALAPAAGIVVAPLVLRGRAGIRTGLVMVAAATPLVLFWLVRNAVEFGNPLFPQSLGPLKGYTSPLGVYETPIARHILDGNWEIVRRWLRLARELVGFAFLLPAGAAVAGALAWRRGRRDGAVIAAIVLVSALGYLWTPFTGGGPDGTEFLIGSQLRYLLPALLLSAPLIAAVAPRWVSLATAAAMLVFGAVKLAEKGGARPELKPAARDVFVSLVFAAVAVALAAQPGLVSRALRRPAVAAAGCALLLAGATAVVLCTQDPAPPSIAEAALARCSHPKVGIVAATNVRSLMGRDFGIDVVTVDRAAPAGRQPILDPAALDRRVAELRPDLVVGQPSPTQAPGWHGPPGWREIARQGVVSYYAPPGGCARG